MPLTQPMMQPKAHYRTIRSCVNMDTIPTAAPALNIRNNSLQKLLTFMFRQDKAHGRLTLKRVSMQMQSMPPLLKLQRKERLKPVNRGGRNAPCKVLFWVRNGCLAVAHGIKGKRSRVYSGDSEHRYRSEAEALKRCRADGVPTCKIIAPEGCSLPYL